MITIKNAEMPKKCSQCSFCIKQKSNDYGSFGECSLQGRKTVDCLVWSRDSGCPLIEQEFVLDKVRTELIQSIQNGILKIESGNEELFRIIDKYKTESEDKE